MLKILVLLSVKKSNLIPVVLAQVYGLLESLQW